MCAYPPGGGSVNALGDAGVQHIARHPAEQHPDAHKAPEVEVQADDHRHQPQAQQRHLLPKPALIVT